MENTDNKNYYTFAEIIRGLRKNYYMCQSLIRELENYIRIDSEAAIKFKLNFLLGGAGLYLSVDRQQSLSEKIFMRDDMITRMKNHIPFRLIDKNGELSFEKVPDTDCADICSFDANVSIDNVESFRALYEALKSIDLYNLPDFHEEVGFHQRLWFLGDKIVLIYETEKSDAIWISYRATSDSVHVSAKKTYPSSLIGELLETRIPKYLFPPEYISLLEKNKSNFGNLYIDGVVRRREEELEFVPTDNEKTMHLTRKSRIGQYVKNDEESS